MFLLNAWGKTSPGHNNHLENSEFLNYPNPESTWFASSDLQSNNHIFVSHFFLEKLPLFQTNLILTSKNGIDLYFENEWQTAPKSACKPQFMY